MAGPIIFKPKDVQVYTAEGRAFADESAFTIKQMATTLNALLEVEPEAQFTPGELVGYHSVQYGTTDGITRAVVERAEDDPGAQATEAELELHFLLARVLGNQTVGSIAQRIRLGNNMDVVPENLASGIADRFNVVPEQNHIGEEVVSLYPKEGLELRYRGRSEIAIGASALGLDHMMGHIKVKADVLELIADDPNRPDFVTLMTSDVTPVTASSVNLL